MQTLQNILKYNMKNTGKKIFFVSGFITILLKGIKIILLKCKKI